MGLAKGKEKEDVNAYCDLTMLVPLSSFSSFGQ